MNNKILLAAMVLLTLGAGAVVLVSTQSNQTQTTRTELPRSQPAAPPTQSAHSEQSHASTERLRIPAYQTASEVRNLPPTLSPAKFFGKAQEAYKVALEIPKTLAQLPCYCHCDQSFGHKSLHTCFVDDHAAHCAVCVDEALLAYQLERVEKMTPDQVRARIVEKYSAEHQH